jgi:hypothetical protein
MTHLRAMMIYATGDPRAEDVNYPTYDRFQTEKHDHKQTPLKPRCEPVLNGEAGVSEQESFDRGADRAAMVLLRASGQGVGQQRRTWSSERHPLTERK